MKNKSWQKWVKVGLFLVVFGGICFFYFGDLENHPLHVDEHAWVRRGGYYFEKYFVDRDFSREVWRARMSYDQAKLPEYLYGGWLRLWYGEDVDELFARTEFNEDWVDEDGYSSLWESRRWWMGVVGREDPMDHISGKYHEAYRLIVVCRYLAVVMAMLALVAVFLAGRELGGYWVGLVAVILLASHPVFFDNSRVAIAQSVLVTALAWGFWLYLRWFVEVPHKWWRTVGFGVVVGLAWSAKLNGVMLLMAACLDQLVGLVVVGVSKDPKFRNRIREVLLTVLIWSLVGFGVFVLLNPFLWQEPLEGVGYMYRHRAAVTRFLASKGNDLYDLPSRFGYIVSHVVVGEWVGDLSWSVGDVVRFLVGLLGGVGLMKLVMREKISGSLRSLLIWCGSVLMMISAYIMLDIDRYYQPLIPFVVVVEVLGVGWIMRKFWRVM